MKSQKRDFMRLAVRGAALGLGASALNAPAQHAPSSVAGPVLLTVSGLIGKGNRGPVDPLFDQLMVKQQVKFQSAHAFDFAALAALPAQTIKPTLEYDAKVHELKGPLITDILKASGVAVNDRQSLLLRGIDGYAVAVPSAEAIARRFIMATHLDGRPLALGGLGPLWAVFEVDRFPELMSQPLKQRFALCPWGTYHIDVTAA